MTVSERLKKIRTNEKLSQTEFAERLNVSRSTLMLVEQGKRDLNTKILEALKKEFNISADWLLFGDYKEDEPKEKLFYFVSILFMTYQPVFLQFENKLKNAPSVYEDKYQQNNYDTILNDYNKWKELYVKCEKNLRRIHGISVGTFTENLSQEDKNEILIRSSSFVTDAMELCHEFGMDYMQDAIENSAEELANVGWMCMMGKLPYDEYIRRKGE